MKHTSNPSPKKIVLTGGPGAGKTVIAIELSRRHRDRLALVPEAATQVYAEAQTRWDRLDLPGRRAVQRKIYHLQREQEEIAAAACADRTLLLDRGTIDGAAYWPEGADAYWDDLGSNLQQELERYDRVIWLETSAALDLYDGDISNAFRFEDAQAAIKSGQFLKTLWCNHPRLTSVRAYPKLEDKIAAVEQLLFDSAAH